MAGMAGTSNPNSGGSAVTYPRIANLAERVTVLLADPDSYFTAAQVRARAITEAEVEADLAGHARARQNHRPDTTDARRGDPDSRLRSRDRPPTS